MGRIQRNKGSRVEREMVALLNESPTINSKRVPLSGMQAGYKGDIHIDLALTPSREQDFTLLAEVKARKNGAGFATLERWIEDCDLLILKRDRADPFVAMPFKTFKRLVETER